MGTTTGIEWTDHTFNPWWGCVKVSPAWSTSMAEHGRIATCVRMKPDLHERVAREAAARGWSMNVLVTRAVEHYLDDLIPADEIEWTR